MASSKAPEEVGYNPVELAGLNLLSLDGGGITGLSSLLIIKELMTRMQEKGQMTHVPKPCEHFDMIAGTGTGAISAVILGRLRMSIDDAIASYVQLMKTVFSERKHTSKATTTLERELKEMVRRAVGDGDERMMEKTRGEGKECKVVVYAMSAYNMTSSLPVAFRSYTSATAATSCTVWEVLRATTSHPQMFKSIEVDVEGTGVRNMFTHGGMGCTNPTPRLLEEAERVYPGRAIASMVSIGTGHPNTIQIATGRTGSSWTGGSMMANVLQAAQEMAEGSERVAEEMSRRFVGVSASLGYYRLNVQQGAQGIDASEWERLGEVAAHTRTYLDQAETQLKLDGVIEAISQRAMVFDAAQIDGRAMHVPAPIKDRAQRYLEPSVQFTGQGEYIDKDKYLESLRPAKLARFDSELSTEVSRRACTKDTRTKILDDSMAWSDSPDSAKIYWMNGMAGTGKTTIAYSLCERLNTGKQLAASFFCTRASPECREAKRIIPTIAYQLARRFAPFRYSLCQQLEQDPDIGTSRLSDQFDLLLKTPLMKAKGKLSNNLVVVVDALDECSDPHIVELFLDLLLRSAMELPIKFFVTSRPEPIIWNKMMPESEYLRSILYLHEIEQTLVQADIELYLMEELRFMSPAQADIKKLADRAGKLFIYAATAARYIRPVGKVVNSQARLAAILAASTGSGRKLSAIDALYSAILTATLEDEEFEPEERDHIRVVLWTVICACEPILIRTLSILCGLDNKSDAVIALQPLRSVLHVPAHNEIVTTLHASFPDYMFAQERSGRFFCDRSTHDQLLTKQCFKIMQAQLRFNICSIESSFVPDHQIPGIEERASANISDELFYACRFWADHLTRANPPDILLHDFPVIIYNFLSRKFLFWMEVLNLKRCIVTCAASLDKLNTLLIRAGVDASHDLLRLISDALKFGSNYATDPASSYTPHIYLSALPFSSPSSSVRSLYWPRFKGLVTVSGTVMKKLEQTTLGTWEYMVPVESVAFSPDGHRIALGSGNGELWIQSVYDGRHALQPFRAHKKPITCVRFSRDGMQIVSGSYGGSIAAWSAQSGSLISGPYQGHNGNVLAVEFSPDGMHIASGSADCAVGISVAYQSAGPMRRLIGHKRPVGSISFSPDGRSIISGSADETARIWDLSSGATTRIIQLKGITSSFLRTVLSVRYLPNGAHFIAASGGSGSTVHTWDASGCLCSNSTAIKSQDRITSIAVSPDGDCVASGLASGEIYMWTRHDGELLGTPFVGHSGEVESIHFSNDGSRIISASRDNTIRIWNIHGRAPAERTKSLKSGSRPSSAILSPDNVHAAIYNGGNEIHIWNIREARPVISASCPEEKIVFLQYSHDETRIFSVHTSGKIYTWSALTAQLVDGPYRFSSYDTLGYEHAVCSPDGTRVVATRDNGIELWDAQSSRLIAVCKATGHRNQRSPKRPVVVFSLKTRKFLISMVNSKQRDIVDQDGSNSDTLKQSPVLTALKRRRRRWDIPGGGIGFLEHGYIDPIIVEDLDNDSSERSVGFAPTHEPDLTRPLLERRRPRRASPRGSTGVVEVWDSDSGERVAGPFEVSPTQELDISPDGTHIAYWGDHNSRSNSIHLIDVNRGETLSMPRPESSAGSSAYTPSSVKFTPDGNCVAYPINDTYYMWDIRNQTVVATLTTIPHIKSLAYSGDGWCLATSQDPGIPRNLLDSKAPRGLEDRRPFELFLKTGHVELGPLELQDRHTERLEDPESLGDAAGETPSSILQVWGLHADDPHKPFTLRADGWVVDDQSQPLFWVPIDLRPGFPDRTVISVADDGTICGVNYRGMVVGDSWSECYLGD